jgi:hypothetical protein
VADLPYALDGPLAARLAHALDTEGKIPRALEALGPVTDRDVLLLDAEDDGVRAGQLRELGGRVRTVPRADDGAWAAPAAEADVVIGLWSVARGADAADLTAAERLLRPGGRLLLVHDYGRDDVARLLGEPPEPEAWSRRDGPFLADGWKIRVIHCFWTFDTLEATQAFLHDAFGEAGETVAATLHRPRVSYNLAIYHRTVGEVAA